ncbi:UNVERIFIED_ORG: McrC family protein [Roseateles sp. XES5]|nr:McrC family protein [Roseateles sp. XES5]
MIRRTILEWESMRYGGASDEIPTHAADRIAAVAARSPLAGRGGGGVLEHGRRGLRARGVVGVIAAEGCALEILPKIDFKSVDGAETRGHIRRRLVHMLATALDLKIDSGQITTLEWQRETLLEILIRLFSEKLVDAVRLGMPRRYVEHTEDLPVLRGRLDLTRQFTLLAAEPSRLACRYDALTVDIALNRIMKAAIVRLARISRAADNQRRLRELAFAYADIESVQISALRWDEVVLDRTNSRWRELFNLARLLLGERFQTSSAGGSDGFSLLFEMNTLFEEYVARMLKRSFADTDIRVVSQGGRLYCLETVDGRGLFQTRPDILLKRGDEVVQVIDTKWKRIAARMDDRKQGVSQGDVYQMMAYGHLYQCDQLTLLYPHHAAIPHQEGVLVSHQVTGSSYWLKTASIDLSKGEMFGERLRAIISYKSEPDQLPPQ